MGMAVLGTQIGILGVHFIQRHRVGELNERAAFAESNGNGVNVMLLGRVG